MTNPEREFNKTNISLELTYNTTIATPKKTCLAPPQGFSERTSSAYIYLLLNSPLFQIYLGRNIPNIAETTIPVILRLCLP